MKGLLILITILMFGLVWMGFHSLDTLIGAETRLKYIEDSLKKIERNQHDL